MKKTLLVTVFVVFFLLACTQQTTHPITQDFLQIFPLATEESERFSEHTMLTREVFSQECDAEPPYTRRTYTQLGAQLIVYEHNNELLCSLINIRSGELTIEQGDLENAPEDVAFEVNGEALLFSTLENFFNQLPQEERTIQNLDLIANQLINQKLLEQEIRPFVVNVQDTIQQLLLDNNLTQEELEEQLQLQAISMEEFREEIEQELKIRALLEDTFGTVVIEEEQLQAFYVENTDAFIRSEQVVFQQIFVQETNPELAQTRINTILQSLNNTDFCSVVLEFSDDQDSSDRCGTYTIARNVVFAELEQALFTNNLQELFVVEGPQGYHLINILERTPTTVMSFLQARDIAREFLEEEINQLRLNAYLAILREEANIVSYLSIDEQTTQETGELA